MNLFLVSCRKRRPIEIQLLLQPNNPERLLGDSGDETRVCFSEEARCRSSGDVKSSYSKALRSPRKKKKKRKKEEKEKNSGYPHSLAQALNY